MTMSTTSLPPPLQQQQHNHYGAGGAALAHNSSPSYNYESRALERGTDRSLALGAAEARRSPSSNGSDNGGVTRQESPRHYSSPHSPLRRPTAADKPQEMYAGSPKLSAKDQSPRDQDRCAQQTNSATPEYKSATSGTSSSIPPPCESKSINGVELSATSLVDPPGSSARLGTFFSRHSASPVSILPLRSPAAYMDGHGAAVGGPGGLLSNGGSNSANNFNWSPTTAMFFNPKSNGPPSSRFQPFKRESFETGPITPSLYSSHAVAGTDGQHHCYPGLNNRYITNASITDGSGTVTSGHHSDWNAPHASWTGLPTPSTEAVLKSIAGTGHNTNGSAGHGGSLSIEPPTWEQLNSHSLNQHKGFEGHPSNGTSGHTTLFNGHASPAMLRSGNCANSVHPPTPRGMLSAYANSRSVPRSAGLSWLYSDMGMSNFNANGNSSSLEQYPGLIRQSGGSMHTGNGDHHGLQQHQSGAGMVGGMHPFNFAPQQTTLGRPPLSARAPRLRPSGDDIGGGSIGSHGDYHPGHSIDPHDQRSTDSPNGSEISEGVHGQYYPRVDPNYATDEAKWIAVQTRDARASASFFYCVMSTKIFCRTTCPSRRPVRENITFVDSAAAANALGYRACKRCKPDVRGGDPHEARQEILINKVKERLLQGVLEGGKGKAVKGKGLKYIAEDLGVSHWHLHRCFKKRVNQTPEAWAKAQAKKIRHRESNNNGNERDEGRDSVGPHSIGGHSVASSSSVALHNGMRGEPLIGHHHRHSSHHMADHSYAAGPRVAEMMAYGN